MMQQFRTRRTRLITAVGALGISLVGVYPVLASQEKEEKPFQPEVVRKATLGQETGSSSQKSATPEQREKQRELTIKYAREAARPRTGESKKGPTLKMRGATVDVDTGRLQKGRRGSYYGMGRIVEFTNSEARNPATTCGQAAAATILVRHNKIADNSNTVKRLERAYPPNLPPTDIPFKKKGELGTSPDVVERALYDNGMNWTWRDVSELRNWVSKGYPVIALLDNGKLGGTWYSMHYVVVFGCDDKYVYVTNSPYNRLTWSRFNDAIGSDLLNQTALPGQGRKNKILLAWPK